MAIAASPLVRKVERDADARERRPQLVRSSFARASSRPSPNARVA